MPPRKDAKKDEKKDRKKLANVTKFPKGISLSQYPLIRGAQVHWEGLAVRILLSHEGWGFCTSC